MAKRYDITVGMDAGQAIKAARDLRGEVEKINLAGQKLGRTLGGDFAAASPKVKKFTGDVTATTQAFATMTRTATTAWDQVVAGTKRATKATKEKEQVDIGYFKFVADSLKRQAKLEQDAVKEQARAAADARKRTADFEKKHVIDIQQVRVSGFKANSDLIDKQFDDERKAKKKQIQWERKHVIDINQVQASGFKAASDLIEKHRKDYETAKKKQIDWERKNVIDVSQMNASALQAKSGLVDKQLKEEEAIKKRWLDWEKKNVYEVGKLEESAAHMKSKSIDKQLAAQQKYQSGFTKALTDQEIAQDVANRKMQKSNDQRVSAAMKAAGIEEESNQTVLRSLGMMIVRFAAYHAVIGTATAAWREHGEAIKQARAEQDKMLDEFVDERSELRRTAATLGRVNDNQFYGEVKQFQANTGMKFGDANQFIRTVGEGSAQYISQPGETEAQQKERGRTITRTQSQSAMEMGARFGQAHGLTDDQTANLLAVSMGSKDVRGMGAKGVDEVMKNFVRPTLALEHGRGTTPILQNQLAEFHAAYGTQFRSMEDEAITLSTVAQGTPAGRVYTQTQGLLAELANPNKDLRKVLQSVPYKGGTLLGRGKNGDFAPGTMDQDKIEAIRAFLDKSGLKGIARENWIRKHFTAKTGLRAALQLFGENAAATEAERRAYMDKNASPAAMASDLATREGSEDLTLQRARGATDQAKMQRFKRASPIKIELEAGAKSRQQKELTGGSREAVGNVIDKIVTLGQADNSELMKVRLETQNLLLKEIESSPNYDMRFRGRQPVDRMGRGIGPKPAPGSGYVPFGPMAPDDRVRADLGRLKAERDRLRALDAKANAKKIGPQASLDSVGGSSDASLVAAVDSLKATLDRNNALITKAMEEAGRGRQVTFASPNSLPLSFMPTQLNS